MDSTNPYTQPSTYVDLLNSQQDNYLHVPSPYESFSHGKVIRSSQIPLFSSQATETASFCEDSPTERKERKKWSLSDDLVLISAWLNTSKDPVVSNEQKAGVFWQRIANYFAASPKVGRGEEREPIQCKKRWQKMNDLVCKFCGAYAAPPCLGGAEKDQKWCAVASAKIDGPQSSGGKKRRCEDGAQSASSDHPTKRPPGVKAAKGACSKRTIVDEQGVAQFQNMVSIKEKDMALKERLSKMGLLDSLISKKEKLFEYEEALKKKLITEMLGD